MPKPLHVNHWLIHLLKNFYDIFFVVHLQIDRIIDLYSGYVHYEKYLAKTIVCRSGGPL